MAKGAKKAQGSKGSKEGKGGEAAQRRRLADAAEAAFATGDYVAARKHDAHLLELGGEGSLVTAAQLRMANLSYEPFAFRVGLAAIAVYALVWVLAL